MKVNKKDKYVALGLMAFIAFWGWQTTLLSDRTMKGAPGPKFFPWVILGLLLFLSIILLIQSLRAKEDSDFENPLDLASCRDEDEDEEESESALKPRISSQPVEVSPLSYQATDPQTGEPIVARFCHCFYNDGNLTGASHIGLSMIVILMYVVAIEYIGFYVASVPAMIVVLRGLMHVKEVKKILLSTALIIGGIYFIFTILLKLTLPTGTLW